MNEVSEPGLRADARANRDAILAAAARLYARRDPAVPSADIAKEAGVGRATLARRFPTADSLRDAVLEQLIAELQALVPAAPSAPGALHQFIEDALDVFDANAPLVDLVRSPSRPTPSSEAVIGRLQAALAEPLRQAQTAGRVDADLDTEDVRLVLFMASSATRSFTGPGSRARITRLVDRALAPAPAPRGPEPAGAGRR